MSIVKFSTLLNEAMKSAAETTANRTHLEHAEDRSFDGHEGVADASSSSSFLNSLVVESTDG